MMKKIFFVVFASFLFCFILTAEDDKSARGTVAFSAQREDNRYLITLHFRQPLKHRYTVKAVKVTYEPSGTIPLIICGKSCTESDKEIMLLNVKPLSSIESSTADLEELAPKISLDYPQQIKDDKMVKIEYLIEQDGTVSTLLAAAVGVSNTDNIEFSVKNGKSLPGDH